jgi:biopolymer transport protein ExbB
MSIDLPSALSAACLALGAAPNGLDASSILGLLLKGGWIMVPIGACSLVALTIIVERALILRRARVAPPGLLNAVRPFRNDPVRAAQQCASDPSPAAAVLLAAIKSTGEPRDVRDRLVEEAGQRQVVRFRQRMRLLSALPQSATMLGLLGTVFGMIRTFTVVAASGESLGKTERLAQGIYEAWTATAAGLFVAIPVLLCYHMLMARIDSAAALLDKVAVEWLDEDTTSAPRPAAAAPAAAPVVVRSDLRVIEEPAESTNGVAVGV